MPILTDLLAGGLAVPAHRPWPRSVVDASGWETAAARLAASELTLVSIWGEPDRVHMALGEGATIAVLTLPCPEGTYPSIGRSHPPALRLERALQDLFGLVPEGLPDARAWLDHGVWDYDFPLGRSTATRVRTSYAFLPAEGQSLHQVAVGPVHAGIIEPGHFRFTMNGETVVRIESRLGYAHKGIDSLLIGAELERAARIAGRVSGDSTVAYAWAFAMAAEAATETEAPARAVWLRALMAELERLANHLGDIGAVCNDAGFAFLNAHFGALRERVLRASDAAFGHRLMRDRIVPGGIAADLDPEGNNAIDAVMTEIRRQLPRLIEVYDETASLQDRTVGTGVVKPDLARQYGAGGYVGRASGRDFDAREAFRYPPYDQLSFEVPVLAESDVDARVWIRIREVQQSLALIAQILERLPDGPLHAVLPSVDGPREAMALVEGFRGDVLVWLQLAADGRIARCHLRDPSWFQWPLVEAATEGNIIADFPLLNKSFNCAYSGHDL